jgi:hypothetical protein
VPTEKQRAAAQKNVGKAQAGARSERTIAHLPESTRTALATQANRARRSG